MVDVAFLNELASKAPTPGGGGASAYCGALAAALGSMVGNLTVGKARYAAVEEEMRFALAELEDVRVRLVELVEEDACAFAPLAEAYRMSASTPEEAAAKEAAMQAALIGACEVPLEIMRQCMAVIELSHLMAQKGSRLALSDAGVSAAFAKAALQGASLNVRINLSSMADGERACAYRDEMDDLLARGCSLADEVFSSVAADL